MKELSQSNATISKTTTESVEQSDRIFALQREFYCIVARYNRHFALKTRATRDLRQLDEFIAHLLNLKERVDALWESAETIETIVQERISALQTRINADLALFEGEGEAIVATRGSQILRESTAYLADRINEQFAVYRGHFAGHPRLSRRPRLLQRAIDNLQEIHDELSDPAFDALEDGGVRATNLQLVAENLISLRREMGMVELEHQASSVAERIASLGTAANALIQEYNLYYAGQERTTRDLPRLGLICDRLAELALQMGELSSIVNSQANARNLEIVQFCLQLYEQEYQQISSAKEQA
ncbi:hypothetical protein F7734_28525 [Scytonema sp. UIC 10036]|uniref:hypothetical protein n=1 Tax=Scytonema sp. UIC 10036 TaxID=2304196 RepID=UPI0012DAB995|nr:hypothetical protein [Scytonema sp. UIC 10036]MUG96075.1 hypothetical protein [Scytonema sp. UIC 10036]